MKKVKLENLIDLNFKEHILVAQKTEQNLSAKIVEVCEILSAAIIKGNKILLFGNGGSAGDAQHIAAEFIGRYVNERKALPAIALTTDTSVITAIGNDYGFDKIFERQVDAIANSGDILIGISTSGKSQNVINAIKFGKLKGYKCIGLTGNDGGLMNDICDVNLVVRSNITARIQEMHILIGHIICEYFDNINYE